MKRILWGLCLLLFVGGILNAESYIQQEYVDDVFNSREIGPQLYDAFVQIPYLLREQKQLKARGSELEESQQEQLRKYQQEAKGVKVVLAGYKTCTPCFQLFNLLDQEDENHECLLDELDEQGVEFFILNTSNEKGRQYTADSLMYVWNIQSVPVLLILKDGWPVARLEGFHKGKSDEIVRVLKEQIALAK